MKIQFFLWAYTIQTRFSIINKLLKDGTKNLDQKNPNSHKFGKLLDEVLEIHSTLTEAARKLNTIYNVQLLLSFIILFILIVGHGYIVLYTLTVNSHVNENYIIYSAIKLFSLFFFESSLLILAGSNLSKIVSISFSKFVYKYDFL